MVYGEEEMSF